MSEIKYIREQLSKEELLCQLAEEAAELGQAALKLRRAIDGKNYTPVSVGEAIANLQEEIADVWVSLQALGLDRSILYEHNAQEKIKRWADRLKANAVETAGRRDEE